MPSSKLIGKRHRFQTLAFGRTSAPDLRCALALVRRFAVITAAVLLSLVCVSISPAFGQTPVLTQHYDNARTGQNLTETVLTPANVNSTQFGKLFTQALDGQMPAQPLYVPGVLIPATNSTHNVVYVATMHDSVYAFDADSNQGSDASPLWYVNFLDPANGITSVPETDEFCKSDYTEFGIQGTPVIDTTRNAIYVLAVTKENGAYVHRLHALNLGTGAEMFGGPTVITGSVTIDNQLYTFIDKYQQERPALLEQDGVIYIGFGGPGCNVKTENGWVMAYDGGTLQQVGVFDASPDVMASAVWLSGAGLAGDGNGNIYANTGDGLFDANEGGSHYGDSVLKFNQGDGVMNLVDSFTPYNQRYFQLHDLDVSSGGITLLPPVPEGNFAVAVDKNGTIYLLNQDALGGYDEAGDSQIPQELDAPVLGQVHAGLTYWNNTVYLGAYDTPVLAYAFANGQLSLTPTSQTPAATSHPQGGIVSSNGATAGIFWYVSVPTSILFAFDATNLANEFYNSSMAAGKRDALGSSVHFEMPIVADGRVYVNGKTELAVFGLLPDLVAAAGNNQSGQAGTELPIALQAAIQNPYTGPIQQAGVPVTFAAVGKVGSFSNAHATTNSSGIASTSYTLPNQPGTYTITASSTGYAPATFTVTATPGTPSTVSISSGNSQKTPVETQLALPLAVKVRDAGGNGLGGVQVAFSDGGAGGIVGSPTATTNSAGIANTTYSTGTVAGMVDITGTVTGLTPATFKETVLAGPATSLGIYSGNNQTVKPGVPAPKELEVLITDQYGNPASGISVSFSDGGAGGSFSENPVLTSAKGIAAVHYTTPLTAGTVTVTASSSGLPSALFTINVN
jgi:hypothetical protein